MLRCSALVHHCPHAFCGVLGGLDALMRKPQREDSDVRAGLEQVHRGRVMDHMWCHPPSVQVCTCGRSSGHGLLQKMVERVGGQLRATDGRKGQALLVRVQNRKPEVQNLGRLGPDGPAITMS